MKNAQMPTADCSAMVHGIGLRICSRLKNTNTAINSGATPANSNASERRSL